MMSVAVLGPTAPPDGVPARCEIDSKIPDRAEGWTGAAGDCGGSTACCGEPAGGAMCCGVPVGGAGVCVGGSGMATSSSGASTAKLGVDGGGGIVGMLEYASGSFHPL